MTRDRVSYDANWNGRAFTVVDTGGWDPDARGLAERIARPGRDRGHAGRRGAVRGRRDGRHHRRRRGRRQDPAHAPASRSSWRPTRSTTSAPRPRPTACGTSGWASRTPVSALHGRGSGDLLDAVLAALPEPPPERDAEVGGPRRIAIVGKPNVGKSSLLNKLAGEERVVVDNVAGTTVDPVDELVELGGRTWRFIDTAGHPQAGQGGVRARVLRLAAHHRPRSTGPRSRCWCSTRRQSISEQDLRILQTVREAGRALVIAFNKWDLVDEERRYYLDREIERELVQVQWAPRINVTARDRLARRPAGARRSTRRSRAGRPGSATGALNAFLGRLVAEHPHPVRSGKQPKILFGTQAGDRAADVRAVHQRQAGGGVRALHRAPAARGVRLRRHADRAAAAGAGEAQALDT